MIKSKVVANKNHHSFFKMTYHQKVTLSSQKMKKTFKKLKITDLPKNSRKLPNIAPSFLLNSLIILSFLKFFFNSLRSMQQARTSLLAAHSGSQFLATQAALGQAALLQGTHPAHPASVFLNNSLQQQSLQQQVSYQYFHHFKSRGFYFIFYFVRAAL